MSNVRERPAALDDDEPDTRHPGTVISDIAAEFALFEQTWAASEAPAGDSRQADLFVADILDASPKSDLGSLEHPLFALRAGDRAIRRYERGDTVVEVQPGVYGLATIHDKDLWIYAVSQLRAAANAGQEIGRTVRFTAHAFLTATDRGTSGRSYDRLLNALNRLAGTRVLTNIRTKKQRSARGFGLLESFEIVERNPDTGRMCAIAMTLPDWLYRAIVARECLTLHREYFGLRQPLERRIYELARKHVGSQASWVCSLTVLHQKSGSRAALKKFRAAMRSMSRENRLPGYRLSFDLSTDQMTFYARTPCGARAEFRALKKSLGGR